jgi:hypothetical protein
MSEKITVKHIVSKGSPAVQYITKNSIRKFPILGILTIIFVIAKIFDKLDWNWFVVFWPLWIIPAIFLSVVTALGVFFLLAVGWFALESALEWYKYRKNKRRG